MKLLITRCSKNKFDVENKRAIDVYKGANFVKLRRFYPISGLDVRIISAKYGLITPETIISKYDVTIRKLSTENRDILSKKVTRNVEILLKNNYDMIFLDLGKDYLDIINLDLSKYPIVKENRSIGYQLHTLEVFLESFNNNTMKDFEQIE